MRKLRVTRMRKYIEASLKGPTVNIRREVFSFLYGAKFKKKKSNSKNKEKPNNLKINRMHIFF